MRPNAYVVASIVTLFAPAIARARDAPSVDEAPPEDDDRPEAEIDALGPRGNLRAHADTVSFDARGKTLDLSGNVRLDAPPFHLRADALRLARTRYGLEIDGKGALAFCPCLGTPLTVEFDHAIVAPPGDLVLTDPTLRFYGVPVFHLPYFWLRSEEKLGVLPPDVAYRGGDGLFLGDGVHLPWRTGASRSALDLRGGAYVPSGFAVDARLRTPTTFTKVRYDRVPGADGGVVVDARGATRSSGGGASVTWDVDALRGRRAVDAATELDAAAKPWDRAAGEAALRVGPLALAEGVRVVSRRGGGAPDFDAAGPITSLRASGAARVAADVTWDATFEGGALRTSGSAASASARAATASPGGAPLPETVTFARAELGAFAAGSLGALAASLAARAAGDVAAESATEGVDHAAEARARLGVPLARRFGDEPDALVHTLEPFLEAAALHAHGDALLGVGPGRGMAVVDGTAPVTEAGVTTALGRPSQREALDATLAAGAAYGDRDAPRPVRPLARGRAAATLAWLGVSGDAGWVASTPAGFAGALRARLGPSGGLHLAANVAVRDGVDPVLARLLTSAEIEPPTGLLARPGATGGASLVVPWSRAVTTSVGADGDATARELVAARAGLELRDRCQCVTLRANAAHRIGRDGLDAWLSLEFAANR